MSSPEKLTPMLTQYREIKRQHPQVLLMFRLGDFYELFGEDAELASRLLELTLTSRPVGKDKRWPMCGVPYHAADRYIARLIALGHKVAICDQMEDPKAAKGIVKRQVTRVVTPGTLVEDSMLEEKSNNYLVVVVQEGPAFGVAVADISTGEFAVTQIEGVGAVRCLLEEFSRLSPAECLLVEGLQEETEDAIRGRVGCVETLARDPLFDGDDRALLCKHFATNSLRGFGCEDLPLAIHAAGALLEYVGRTQPAALENLHTLSTYSTDACMVLDPQTRRNLELTQSLGTSGEATSLVQVLDKTLTAMGGRLLRRWLQSPLLRVEAIRERQDAVAELCRRPLTRGDLRDHLRRVSDVERLTSRAAAGACSPRDLGALRTSLETVPSLAAVLREAEGEPLRRLASALSTVPTAAPASPGDGASPKDCAGSEGAADGPLGDRAYLPRLHEEDEGAAIQALGATEEATGLAPVLALLQAALEDDLPPKLQDGGVIRRGFHEELDHLRSLASEGKGWIAKLEQTERERTGIRNLKVGYNAVFGYYLEVTKGQLSQVPESWIRKQTTTNGERYITPDLKEFESSVLGAEERAAQLELELFTALRNDVAAHSQPLLALARALAQLDVLACLAQAAEEYNYNRPEIDTGEVLEIRNGRHPVVEQLSPEPFVPNDTLLGTPEQRLILLTGPNMAGKSTLLRQTALIVLLAQIGSFVPAESARVGIVDRIFTRVGAQDDLAGGQSTFMVEMTEAANILNNATSSSLILLDEIGRGTSTFDGLSIAWAMTEYLAKVGARTLFATHYHQLNDLERQLPAVKNYRILVREQGHRILWLRRIAPGGTDRSYGIQVARMAGLPDTVIHRAQEVLKDLEHQGKNLRGGDVQARTQRLQLTFLEGGDHPVVDALMALDLETMTPLEALTALAGLQKQVRG
ncbi:MAG TPA: DNA mismatch repair protein MutS [Armatimonadota bacterium]|jgi:DNA mismatch repair protein MutS